MRTVRRLLYREILGATLAVALSFLGLFFFIDLVGQIDDLGRTYSIGQALLACALQLPGHIYELTPIAVLIGTIYALARLAQSSEYTILRTGGLGPGRALLLLTQQGEDGGLRLGPRLLPRLRIRNMTDQLFHQRRQ